MQLELPISNWLHPKKALTSTKASIGALPNAVKPCLGGCHKALLESRFC